MTVDVMNNVFSDQLRKYLYRAGVWNVTSMTAEYAAIAIGVTCESYSSLTIVVQHLTGQKVLEIYVPDTETLGKLQTTIRYKET